MELVVNIFHSGLRNTFLVQITVALYFVLIKTIDHFCSDQNIDMYRIKAAKLMVIWERDKDYFIENNKTLTTCPLSPSVTWGGGVEFKLPEGQFGYKMKMCKCTGKGPGLAFL